MRSRNVFYWIGGVAGGVLLLLGLLLLAAPLFINLDSIHRRIEARFHQETGGQGTFQKLDLHFLPRPHAVIRGGNLSFPGRESLAFEALTVYPKLLPLLRGDFLPTRIQLTSPHTDIDLASSKKGKPVPTPFPGSALEFEIPSAFSKWMNKTDGLVIQVENGRLNLVTRETPSLQFSDIDLSARHAGGILTLDVTCASNFFQHMELKGQLKLASTKTKGTLTLSGFKPGQLLSNPLHPGAIGLDDGVTDLQINFEGMGLESLKAHVNLSAPSLKLSRGPKTITVKGVHVAGSIRSGKGLLVASLSDMTLDEPAMSVSGAFKMDKDVPLASVRLEGKDIDVPGLRSRALDLAGDISVVKDIFAIITDGNVPSISVSASGKSLADLGHLDGYTITGQMKGGKVSLENLGFLLTDVDGTALISRGILSGQRLRAKLGHIEGTEGILAVALTQGATPFRLDIQVDADLAEVHPILKRLITEGAFAEDLRHIRSIEGQATGRLLLNEKEEGLLVDVDCSSCRLKAAYRSLPYPVIVEKGKARYSGNHVAFRHLKGTFGQSKFFLESGLFDWQNEARIDIGSARGTVVLEQIFPLFTAAKEENQWLEKLDGIKGLVSVHSLTMKGPLKNPAAWQYQTDFQVRDFSLKSSFFPGPVNVSTARIRADTKGFRFNDAQIRILDSALGMTGKLEGSPDSPNGFETTLSGTLGSQGMQYLYETLEVPEDFLLRTPLTIQSGRFRWVKSGGVSLNGDVLFPHGPNVSMDVSQSLAKLNIRKLVVKDHATKASFSMLAHEELVDLHFSGKFQKSTLDGLFLKNQFLNGWIEGDLSARILPKQSFSTSAEGFLKGEDIPLYGTAMPANIEEFSLKTEGQMLRVDSVRMILDQNRFVISGDADLSMQDPRFDVDISTENVDLDKIIAFLKKSDDTAVNKKDENPWHFPVRGTAHLMWDSLKIGGYTWQPFQGEITVDPDGVRVSVENARLCGISSPGFLRVHRDGLALAFRLKAEKGNLNQCITCLTQKRVIVEGTFDLDGKIQGKGNWDTLFHNLEGPILFSAADGHVQQAPALAGIISVLSVTDIFQGKLPAFQKEGLHYDLVEIKANLKDGKIHIREGVMNSTAMNLVIHGDLDLLNEQLDLNMLASPFTLTDRLIKLIPVAGYILGGTLISVPVKVDGPMKDPKVRILPLSEIGSGVWGILKRTLETPVKIVEPLVGEEEKAKDKEDESIYW